MAYNREWLQTQIKSYLHDSSVTANLDTWIDLAVKRVSQVLQCYEMEAELFRQKGAAETYLAMDSTVRNLLGVQWESYGGSYINLRSTPRHLAWLYKTTGQPAVYYIQDRNIYPAPYLDVNYKAQVIKEVELADELTAEADAITAYPFIFLNAALAEAYDWKQNIEMTNRYEQKWSTEAVVVRDNYLSERGGETPAMRAM